MQLLFIQLRNEYFHQYNYSLRNNFGAIVTGLFLRAIFKRVFWRASLSWNILTVRHPEDHATTQRSDARLYKRLLLFRHKYMQYSQILLDTVDVRFLCTVRIKYFQYSIYFESICKPKLFWRFDKWIIIMCAGLCAGLCMYANALGMYSVQCIVCM